MKFALAGLSLDNYPPVVAPWERTSGGAEALRYVQKADSLSWDWLTIPEHVLTWSSTWARASSSRSLRLRS